MLLDLRKVRGARERVERRYEPAAFPQNDGEYRVAVPVDLVFDIHKDRDQYHLVGHVRTELRLTCSRCVEPFTRPVEADFDLRYLPHASNTGEGEIEIEEDDLTAAYYRDDVIDLGQLMGEQLQLSLPMKPLCSEACRGLCPECGVNLNVESCNCSRRWEDPRLAPLKNVVRKLNSQKVER